MMNNRSEQYNFRLGHYFKDNNGNTKLTVYPISSHSTFSIQTLGNLPHAHSNREWNENDVLIIAKEVENYVREHGTDKQKELIL